MTINCKGQLLSLGTPRVMGILNLTPDSFFDGGRYSSTDTILFRAEEMLSQGAAFLDLGGYSTRPGAAEVSEEEEIKRLLSGIDPILKRFPDAVLSIDTFRSRVARISIEHGACIINDISCGQLDPDMFAVAASLKVPYIGMHMRGTPQTMQNFTQYDHLTADVLLFFAEKMQQARALGLNDFIADPGFGFSKTLDQNYELMSRLDRFSMLESPVLVGISRKSMLYNLLNVSAKEAGDATTALHMYALQKGANILRVHDVLPAVQTIALYEKLKSV